MSEHQQVEWKASWRDEYLKWICGFANAQGGVLEIGRNNQGRPVGLANAARLMEELPNKIRDTLGIIADVDLVEEDGKALIRIAVEPYPYPVSYQGQYHYRSGSTRQVLKGAALDRFLLGKTGKRWDGVPQPQLEIGDLDQQVLDWFRTEAVRRQRLPASIADDDDRLFIERLRLTDGNYLKRAAALLFHPDPQEYFSGAFIKIGYFKTESDLRFHDIVEGDLFTQLARTLDLLQTKYTHAAIEITGEGRMETAPLPEPALREALVNAIAHRDYSTGNPIQIRVYDDRIEIWNDGRLPENWTVKDLLGKHASVPFNPDVARVFFLAGKIEAWGSGIQRILTACKQYGCPDPRFDLQPIGLMVTLHFLPGAVSEKTGEKTGGTGAVSGGTTQETTQERIITLLRENPELTRKALAKHLGLTPDGIKYHLDKLRKAGRIRHVGPTKKGYWEILENADE